MNIVSVTLALSVVCCSTLLKAQIVEESTLTTNRKQYDQQEAVSLYIQARAISSSMQPVCGDLAKPYIGAELHPTAVKMNSDTKWGHTVHKIDPQSKLYQAGIRPGDLLLSVNDSGLLLSDRRFNPLDQSTFESSARNETPVRMTFSTPDGKNQNTVTISVSQDCGISFSFGTFHGRYSAYRQQETTIGMPLSYVQNDLQLARTILAFESALNALGSELKQAKSIFGGASSNLNIMRAAPVPGQLANALADARRLATNLPFDAESRSKADALAIAILHKMGYSVDSYAENMATAKNQICGGFCFDTGQQGNYDMPDLRSERIAAYVKAVKDSDYIGLVKAAGFLSPEKVLIAIGVKQALVNRKEGEKAIDTKALTSFSLSDAARQQFEEWKTRANPKAFAISSDGQYGWATGPRNALLGSDDHPKNRAMKTCQSRTKETCKFYAIDDQLMKD